MHHRLLTATALLAASTFAMAAAFESRTLLPTGTPVYALEDVAALSNGDIVLHESTLREEQRYSRFDADGHFLGQTLLQGQRQILGPDGGDVLVSVLCDAAEMTGHSGAGQLLWRFLVPHYSYTCGYSPFAPGPRSGIDRDGRVWNLPWMTATSVDAESGRVQSFDLTQAIAADATLLNLFAWPTHAGALVAAESLTAPQFAAVDEHGQVLWRHHTPTFQSTRENWEITHTFYATSNRSGAIAVTDAATEREVTTGMIQPSKARGFHVAVLDGSGQVVWQKDLVPEVNDYFAAQRLYDDGVLAVLTLPGMRMRLFAADGTLLADRIDSTISQCELVAPNGGHWAICYGFGVRKAVLLDDGSSHPLASNTSHIVTRSNGAVLVFAGNTPPYSAQELDGSNISSTFEFATPDFINRFEAPYAHRFLEHGDELLLRLNRITRSNSAGDVLWSTPIANVTQITQTALIAGNQSQLLLVANHACTALSNPNRRIICFDRTTGVATLSRELAGVATEKVRAIVRGDAVELLFRDTAQHVRHSRLNVRDGTLVSRDLGVATMLWLDVDGALVQGNDGAALIESDLAAPAPTVHTLAANSPLRTEQIVDRFPDGDWLSVGYTSTLFGSAAQVRRLDTNFAQRWLREFPGASGRATPFSTDAAYLRVMLRDANGTNQMQFLSATSGATVASPLATTEAEPLLRGPAGAFGSARAVNGTIVWRAWDALGAELAAHAWRCSQACSLIAATIEDGRLDEIVRAYDTHLLRLDNAFAPRNAPIPDNGAIAGVFTAANETNRGYVIDWLPSSRTLFVARFAGDTSSATTRELLDWETMQGVVTAGANEIALTRYRNADGRFASADNAPISPFGSATFRFDGCDRAELVMTTNGSASTERVYLTRSGPRLKSCALLDGTSIPAQASSTARGGFDARQSGAWVAAGTNDQGILAAVLPATANADGVFFAPWFTYWSEAGDNPTTANRHWLTLQGTLTPATNNAVELTIYRATAGSYGAIRPSNTHRIGTATWIVQDCEHATLNYQFDDNAKAQPYAARSGVLNYSRPGACSGGP